MVNPFVEKQRPEPLPPKTQNISDESDFGRPPGRFTKAKQPDRIVWQEMLDDKPVYRLKADEQYGDVRPYFF